MPRDSHAPPPRPDRFALYVHIPFCARKCPWCAFISHELTDPREADDLVTRLLAEAEAYAAMGPWAGASVHSLYIGGGTPSLLAPAQVVRLLAGLRERFSFTGDAECTIELNPGTLRPGLLDAWAGGGINRVSLAVQTLGERTLARLGRIHTADQARESWRRLRNHGRFRVNVDLMYGIEAEDAVAEWARTVGEVVRRRPDHVSAYSLIVEPDTPFAAIEAAGGQVRLDEQRELEQMECARDAFAAAGFEHYEVSNWARPGMRCRHNLSYWDGGSYLSLGPAAHSYDASRRRRFWNFAGMREWMAAVARRGTGVGGEETLTARQFIEERIMLALRMVEGGRENELRELAGAAGFIWPERELTELARAGLIHRAGGALRCTSAGLVLVDEIQARIAVALERAR